MFTVNLVKEMPKVIFVFVLIFLIFNDVFAQPSGKSSLSKTQVLEAEQILSDLGYWILKIDGIKDSSTYHAATAFQKVEGKKRTGVLSFDLLKSLKTASRPKPKFQGAKHIEVDISRQVLFLVNENGIVTHILPVSSGSGEKYFDEGKWQIAETPRGSFTITRKINGTRKASLGNLYYPNYFYNGVAIHGSNSIPFKPASHGCVRIPRFSDKLFSEMISIGMEIYVYE